MRRHEGKVLISVGCATGMGAETARRLAREGAKVVLGDINVAGAQGVADQIAGEGGEALAAECNIAEETQVQALIEAAVARFGRLDLMHVNAARVHRRDTDAVDTELSVFDRILAVNLRGHLLCTKFGVPEMLKSGGGAIVYTSSNVSKVPQEKRMAYQVSKAGLNGLMRHVAKRWGAEGIRANAITPGLIVTDALIADTTEAEREAIRARLPATRLGSVEDIAALVSFLLSDEAGWINGQALSVDGGSVMFG
jgi:NAD(P)-dependent dehydrogenase (short-subunit alcohol dehydrogenase family)